MAALPLPSSTSAQTSVEGVVHAVWDGAVETRSEDRAFFLVRPDGSGLLLRPGAGLGIDDAALGALDRRAVRVLGSSVAAPGAGDLPTLRVDEVRLTGPSIAASPASVGADDFVTILCRFGDDPATPFTPQEIARVHGPTYPGVAQFYQEHSRDPSTMSGNTVIGWYDLPSPRSAYVDGSTTQVGALARDCTAAADPDVDFRQFYGINVQVNGPLGIRSTPPFDVLSLGGSWTLTLDGETRSFGMTWLSGEHGTNYVVTTHEVGHGLGWPHSSGRYGEEYDSRWDVMSRGYLRFEDPFGWLTIHTIANHKRLAGWIPGERIWRPAAGSVETAVLSRSALPPATGYLMAEIPREDGTIYTVEARLEAGHDTPLPGEALVIHEVEGRRAYVVDPDLDGDPNDEGAQWTVGETFEDAARDIRVTVDERLPDGFVVTIANQVEPTCALEVGVLPVEGGSARIQEGGASGSCGRTVAVAATPSDGWRFVEWREDGTAVSSANPFALALETDRSFVATFEEECEVQVSAAPGAGGAAAVTAGGRSGACGRSVTVEATANQGWSFLGWSEDGEAVSTEAVLTFTLDADRALVAEFRELCALTVSAAPEQGGAATVSQGGPSGACGRTVSVVASPVEGWSFVDWAEDGEAVSSENPFTFDLAADRTLVARFDEQCVVTVSAEPEAGGTAAVTDGGAVGECARTVTVEATATDGWTFLRWSEAGEEVSVESGYTFVLTAGRSLVAEFQELCTVTVSATPEEGGTAEVSEGGAEGACGRTVGVTAAAAEGWGFVRWVEGETELSTEPALELVPDEDRTLLAEFERRCVVAVTAEPTGGGTVALGPGDASGACGRTVTVTAQPGDGWLFVEWVEGGQGLGDTPSLELTVGQDRSLAARFVAVEDLATRVLGHILEGGEPPDAAERELLDRIGNGNGELDVGDLLAFLDAHPDALGGGS